MSTKKEKEILNALRALLCGVKGLINDDPLPTGHPGHVAYLNMVAIPRAEDALKIAEHDIITLTTDIQREGHKVLAGTRGTIVHFYNNEVFAVEFPKGIVLTVFLKEVCNMNDTEYAKKKALIDAAIAHIESHEEAEHE
jgi:hypothetical protein